MHTPNGNTVDHGAAFNDATDRSRHASSVTELYSHLHVTEDGCALVSTSVNA